MSKHSTWTSFHLKIWKIPFHPFYEALNGNYRSMNDEQKQRISTFDLISPVDKY